MPYIDIDNIVTIKRNLAVLASFILFAVLNDMF